jgi:hypothetical protein
LGRTRTTVGIDLYNVANSNAVLTYNQTFVPSTDTAAAEQRLPGALHEGERPARF